MRHILRRLSVGLLVVCAIAQIGGQNHLRASASGLVISQVYGAGGNSGALFRNDFVELFNAGGAPITLTGKSVQYASATGTGNFGSNPIALLSGTLQPGQYYLVQLAGGATGSPLPTPDATGTVNMSGTGGKVALVDSTTGLACNGSSTACDASQLAQIIDLVGWDGANFFETAPAPATTSTTAVIRRAGGTIDTDNNSADFVAGPPTPRNTSCTLSAGCVATTNPTISTTPMTVLLGDGFVLTAKVTPGTNPPSTGLAVNADLHSIGGSNPQQFYDDGTHGDAVAGDFTFSLAMPGVATPATYSLPISVSDLQLRAGSATLTLTVATLTAIHDIQGRDPVSPLVGHTATTRGIVTGVKYNGFFIQSADSEVDSDPMTSEGIFVFTNTNPGPPAAAVVGNRVQVSGTVSEFKSTTTDPDGLSMTELVNPTTTVLSADNPVPVAIALTATDLDPAGSIFALEKYEGMRVHVDTVISTSPTDGTLDEADATSISNGLFFAVLPGTARPFREPGIETPLPVPPDAAPGATPPVFDANPERIGVHTFSVFLDPTSAKVYPPPPGTTLDITTGVTVTGITGPLEYSFRSYIIDAEGWDMPEATTPNGVVVPVRTPAAGEFTVATMNLARFFDTTNDGGISDVALTPAAFQMRLAKASLAIRNVMLAPDIIGVQEVENLATLQAIADKVAQDSSQTIGYAAYLMEGNDIGGIDVGFLVRGDSVVVNGIEQYNKDATFEQPDGTSALLNDRPSLILHGGIVKAGFPSHPVTVVVNHLRSLSGIDGGDGKRIRAKRLAQAVDLATKLQALQAAGEHVISVGDYNAFGFNDGYVDVMGLLEGVEADPSNVTLWAPSPVAPPLADLADFAPAWQRYSFLFDGNAQDLDHILVSSNVQPTGIEFARMNADFPDVLRDDAGRPERLSDHDPSLGYFSLGPAIQSLHADPPSLWAPNHKMVPVRISVSAIDAADPAPSCSITGASGDDGTTEGDVVITTPLTVNLRAERRGSGSGRTYTITVACTDRFGNVSLPATTSVFVPHDRRK